MKGAVQVERQRILIVDDDGVNRSILGASLQALGFEVAEETDGSAVLSACRRFQPHAVLMDLYMAEMDGDEASRLLFHHPDFSHIPVIAVTGADLCGAERQRFCRENGFRACIEKPCSVSRLLAVLVPCLARPICSELAAVYGGQEGSYS
ncbi:MAG: response regulator [Thermodesulfobacteriota bacterium]